MTHILSLYRASKNPSSLYSLVDLHGPIKPTYDTSSNECSATGVTIIVIVKCHFVDSFGLNSCRLSIVFFSPETAISYQQFTLRKEITFQMSRITDKHSQFSCLALLWSLINIWVLFLVHSISEQFIYVISWDLINFIVTHFFYYASLWHKRELDIIFILLLYRWFNFIVFISPIIMRVFFIFIIITIIVISLSLIFLDVFNTVF